MKKRHLDLEAMHEFLSTQVEVKELIDELDNIYYVYTNIAMRLSGLDKEPIYEETQSGRYWIERLKDVFKEVQAQNMEDYENKST